MAIEPFVCVTGVAAAIMRNNIDTDQITPGSVGLKVAKEGFSEGLFYNLRFLEKGVENPEFILNQPPFRDSRFLLAGPNFGCGSSREFAVWALRDFGIRAVIANSFGAIFTANCYMNGVAPIVLAEEEVVAIAEELSPETAIMTVDLARQTVISPSGRRFTFKLPALQLERLVDGLDAIDATKRREAEIAAFQAADYQKRPWIYKVRSTRELA